MKKKIPTLLLAMALSLSLGACGGGNAGSAPSESGSGSEPQSGSAVPAPETPSTRAVKDVWNREVEIPYEVKSIVCLGPMAPPACGLPGCGG